MKKETMEMSIKCREMIADWQMLTNLAGQRKLATTLSQ
jgi:hypothetical protein